MFDHPDITAESVLRVAAAWTRRRVRAAARMSVPPHLRRKPKQEWTDRSKTPWGTPVPNSVWNKLPERMRPFDWGTVSGMTTGEIVQLPRVGDPAKALIWLKQQFPEERNILTDRKGKPQRKERVWVGLKGRPNDPTVTERVQQMYADLKGKGWKVVLDRSGRSFWLVDDLDRDVLGEAPR